MGLFAKLNPPSTQDETFRSPPKLLCSMSSFSADDRAPLISLVVLLPKLYIVSR